MKLKGQYRLEHSDQFRKYTHRKKASKKHDDHVKQNNSCQNLSLHISSISPVRNTANSVGDDEKAVKISSKQST